jgi:hypothetical protein
MPVREPQPLLSLAEPPDRYSFYAGVWLTHDLTWKALCDLLAPTLAGVTTTGERRIQDTRAAVGPSVPGLFVLHAGGPMFAPEGSVLPWVGERAVTGRRQHAKAAVLQFRLGNKTRTRAIVTSANLTESGLRTNWELAVWDEQGEGSSPFLGVDLLRQFRRLAKDLPSDDRLDAVLKALAYPLKGRPPTGEIFSSLTDAIPLFGTPNKKDQPVRRIVVVSPAFAGNTDKQAAATMARWCDKHTVVDIYTGYNGTAAAAAAASPGLVLSAGLRHGLEKAAGDVHVHAVPRVDDDGTNARTLHAKAYAFVTSDGRVELFVGSANCTGPGLIGGNREMLVRLWIGKGALDDLLASLNAVEFTGTITPPSAKVPSSVVPEQFAVEVGFVIAPGTLADDALWNGTMTISGLSPGVTVSYRGKPLVLPGPLEIALDPHVAFVEVRLGQRRWPIMIRVESPLSDPGFWERLTAEATLDRPDRELEQFLGDVRLAATPVEQKGGGGKAPEGDDRFAIPAEQRLVRLARHRRGLARLPEATISAALPTLLAGEPSEALAVVYAIEAAYDRGPGAPIDPLLEALTSSIAAFDVPEEDDDQ